MKRVLKGLLALSLIVGGFLFSPVGQADAASSNGYDYTSGSCRVEVSSDYYTYYSGAGTIDAWATQSGGCGTLYYTMKIVDQWGHSASSQSFTGYFSNRTPTKYFSWDKVVDYTAGGMDSDAYMVEIYLYSDSGHNNYLGMANTRILVVK
jgi:hypothetical protein